MTVDIPSGRRAKKQSERLVVSHALQADEKRNNQLNNFINELFRKMHIDLITTARETRQSDPSFSGLLHNLDFSSRYADAMSQYIQEEVRSQSEYREKMRQAEMHMDFLTKQLEHREIFATEQRKKLMKEIFVLRQQILQLKNGSGGELMMFHDPDVERDEIHKKMQEENESMERMLEATLPRGDMQARFKSYADKLKGEKALEIELALRKQERQFKDEIQRLNDELKETRSKLDKTDDEIKAQITNAKKSAERKMSEAHVLEQRKARGKLEKILRKREQSLMEVHGLLSEVSYQAGALAQGDDTWRVLLEKQQHDKERLERTVAQLKEQLHYPREKSALGKSDISTTECSVQTETSHDSEPRHTNRGGHSENFTFGKSAVSKGVQCALEPGTPRAQTTQQKGDAASESTHTGTPRGRRSGAAEPEADRSDDDTGVGLRQEEIDRLRAKWESETTRKIMDAVTLVEIKRQRDADSYLATLGDTKETNAVLQNQVSLQRRDILSSNHEMRKLRNQLRLAESESSYKRNAGGPYWGVKDSDAFEQMNSILKSRNEEIDHLTKALEEKKASKGITNELQNSQQLILDQKKEIERLQALFKEAAKREREVNSIHDAQVLLLQTGMKHKLQSEGTMTGFEDGTQDMCTGWEGDSDVGVGTDFEEYRGDDMGVVDHEWGKKAPVTMHSAETQAGFPARNARSVSVSSSVASTNEKGSHEAHDKSQKGAHDATHEKTHKGQNSIVHEKSFRARQSLPLKITTFSLEVAPSVNLDDPIDSEGHTHAEITGITNPLSSPFTHGPQTPTPGTALKDTVSGNDAFLPNSPVENVRVRSRAQSQTVKVVQLGLDPSQTIASHVDRSTDAKRATPPPTAPLTPPKNSKSEKPGSDENANVPTELAGELANSESVESRDAPLSPDSRFISEWPHFSTVNSIVHSQTTTPDTDEKKVHSARGTPRKPPPGPRRGPTHTSMLDVASKPIEGQRRRSDLRSPSPAQMPGVSSTASRPIGRIMKADSIQASVKAVIADAWNTMRQENMEYRSLGLASHIELMNQHLESKLKALRDSRQQLLERILHTTSETFVTLSKGPLSTWDHVDVLRQVDLLDLVTKGTHRSPKATDDILHEHTVEYGSLSRNLAQGILLKPEYYSPHPPEPSLLHKTTIVVEGQEPSYRGPQQFVTTVRLRNARPAITPYQPAAFVSPRIHLSTKSDPPVRRRPAADVKSQDTPKSNTPRQSEVPIEQSPRPATAKVFRSEVSGVSGTSGVSGSRSVVPTPLFKPPQLGEKSTVIPGLLL